MNSIRRCVYVCVEIYEENESHENKKNASDAYEEVESDR